MNDVYMFVLCYYIKFFMHSSKESVKIIDDNSLVSSNTVVMALQVKLVILHSF